MIDFITAIGNAVVLLVDAIRHAASGNEEDAYAQALAAQRVLSDAIARRELK